MTLKVGVSIKTRILYCKSCRKRTEHKRSGSPAWGAWVCLEWLSKPQRIRCGRVKYSVFEN